MPTSQVKPFDIPKQSVWEAYRRVAKGLRNPRRIRDAQLRIAFLTLSLMLSYPLWLAYLALHQRFILLTEALIVLTTIVLYVLACDPLPPCTSKVTAWLRAQLPTLGHQPPREFINCANGLLDWRTGTLHPHSPDVLTTNQSPVAWNPKATAPTFERYVGDDPVINYVGLRADEAAATNGRPGAGQAAWRSA